MIATWTSGEPVSSDPRPCSLINSCLRSAVIDIVKLLFLDVESPHDPEAIRRSFDQRDRTMIVGGEMKPRQCGETGKLLSVAEQLRLTGSDGEGRDVVQ